MRPVGAFALFVLALLALVSCAPSYREQPELLTFTDVVPRRVEVGDRVEVLGIQLPASDARTAHVTFEGTLLRPGERPLEGQRIEVDGASVTSDKVSTPYTEALQQRFCGRGDEAKHTTFRGTVTVTLPSAHRGVVVYGSVGTAEAPVELDLTAPPPRRAVHRERELEGRRMVAFLGMKLRRPEDPGASFEVAEVEPGGPAAVAGIVPGDSIERFGGLFVQDLSDFAPNGRARRVDVTLSTSGGERRVVSVSVEGHRTHSPMDLVGPGVILGVLAALFLFFWAPTGRLFSWLERRLLGRIRAPARASDKAAPRGFWAWFVAAVRAVAREDLAPTEGELYVRLAPYFVFLSVSATFAAMPFGEVLVSSELDVNVLFLLSVTSFMSVALLTGGFHAHLPFSVLRSLRAVGEVLSLELPAAIGIVSVVVLSGSLSVPDIIASQTGGGASVWEDGAWPWFWNAFRNPLPFLAFALFFATTLVEGARSPYEVLDRRAGKDRHGVRAVVFFFAEWANVFVMCGIASALFLGGWQLPGVSVEAQASSGALRAAGAGLFLLKSWSLVFVVVWLRWTLPRIHPSHLIRMCWKAFIPGSLCAFGLAYGWTMLAPGQAVELGCSLVALITVVLLAAHMALRLRSGAHAARVEPRLSAHI